MVTTVINSYRRAAVQCTGKDAQYVQRLLLPFCFVMLSSTLTIAQSQCPSNVQSARTQSQFHQSTRNSEAMYVGIYHNPQTGLIDAPPTDSFKSAEEVLKNWRIATDEEQRLRRSVEAQIAKWANVRVTHDLSQASLVLIVKLGRSSSDEGPKHGEAYDGPSYALWDDGLYLYARNVEPGLIWCGTEPGGLHGANAELPLIALLNGAIHTSAETH